ncbi:MAG: FAD-binding oxidoreductase [Desulfatibacillaceae bacterium]
MRGLARDLRRIVMPDAVKSDPADLYAYAADATYSHARRAPDAVVLPDNTRQVSEVLKYADRRGVPVVPRGAGSGLSGGCTPLHGGIVLDMKRMRSILEINRGNMTARAQAGVVLGNFHRAVESGGLFYPPDPQSMTVCTLGGNVATRAGGPRGVKYGTTASYVLGCEVALPDGTVMRTGGSCVKQSAGYDLTHLLAGSEGTLGVITEVTVRLLPLPRAHQTALVVCESPEQAARLVSDIIASGTVPAMLEYISQMAAGAMNTIVQPPIDLSGQAYLLMDLDGTPGQVEEDAKNIRDLCERAGVIETRIISDPVESATYWRARASLYPLILTMAKKVIIEDVTVPRHRIPEFLQTLQNITATLGMLIGVGGHAGDGNMHPSILFLEVNEEQEKKARQAIIQIIKAGLALGGTVSGEHGIGWHKAQFLEWELGAAQVELMKRVKAAFDPHGIMNPGKLWLEKGRMQPDALPPGEKAEAAG